MNIHYFGVFLLVWLRASHGADEKPCGEPADIAFILDSSSSIYYSNFYIEQDFVEKIIGEFDIGPTKTQVAALQYAMDVEIEFHLNDFTTKEDIVEKVGSIQQSKGLATYTDKALAKAKTDLFSPSNGAREGVPKIGILLSDGASTQKKRTQVAAKALRDAGITVLAVGIGNVDRTELENVVTPPHEKNFFYVENFKNLTSTVFQGLVAQQACKVIPTTTTTTTTVATTTTPKVISTPQPFVSTTETKDEPDAEKECQGKKADVVFVLDMSSSIWSEDFKSQLLFVEKTLSIFDIDSGKTQVGAVAFSDNATVVFGLDQYNKKTDIANAVLGIKSEGGITNTHKAIDKVVDQMLTAEHGARSDVAHICILITDGRSSVPDDTMESVKRLKKKGIYLFAIGVGNMTDATELKEMASEPTDNFMFEVDGYASLPEIRTLLAYKACEVPQGDQPACPDMTSDIMFGLFNIGGHERGHAANFMKKVGSGFDLSSGNVRFGLREACGGAKFGMDSFVSKGQYFSIIDESMPTNMTTLINDVRMSLSGPKKKSIKKFAVLVISGDAIIPKGAISEAKRLKHFDTSIVVVIHDGLKGEKLKERQKYFDVLASYKNRDQQDPTHVIMVDGASNLPFSIKEIYGLMCNGQ